LCSEVVQNEDGQDVKGVRLPIDGGSAVRTDE
jgi:hypothetical protein